MPRFKIVIRDICIETYEKVFEAETMDEAKEMAGENYQCPDEGDENRDSWDGVEEDYRAEIDHANCTNLDQERADRIEWMRRRGIYPDGFEHGDPVSPEDAWATVCDDDVIAQYERHLLDFMKAGKWLG